MTCEGAGITLVKGDIEQGPVENRRIGYQYNRNYPQSNQVTVSHGQDAPEKVTEQVWRITGCKIDKYDANGHAQRPENPYGTVLAHLSPG